MKTRWQSGLPSVAAVCAMLLGLLCCVLGFILVLYLILLPEPVRAMLP